MQPNDQNLVQTNVNSASVSPAHDSSRGDSPSLHATSSQPPHKSEQPNKFMVGLFVVLILAIVGVGIYLITKPTNKNQANNSNRPASNVAVVPASYTPAEVDITSTGFNPATVSIKVGQAVSWKNTDSSPHVIASDPYPTDSGLSGLNSRQQLDTNDSYSYIFTTAGTYTYHDNLNPYKFKGTVIVEK